MRTFGTYVVTINLFSLHLMNFMLHAMLDATGVVLRLHYKSMKCDVLFSQGIVCTIFRWGGHFSYMSTKIYSSLQQCKNYKNRSRLSQVMVTNVLPPFFMVHSVYSYHKTITVFRALHGIKHWKKPRITPDISPLHVYATIHSGITSRSEQAKCAARQMTWL